MCNILVAFVLLVMAILFLFWFATRLKHVLRKQFVNAGITKHLTLRFSFLTTSYNDGDGRLYAW